MKNDQKKKHIANKRESAKVEKEFGTYRCIACGTTIFTKGGCPELTKNTLGLIFNVVSSPEEAAKLAKEKPIERKGKNERTK